MPSFPGNDGELASPDPPMRSMVEFTAEMKQEAEQQQGLVPIVAELLTVLVDHNDRVSSDKEITVFHAQKAPAVSVMDYAERIAKYSSCSFCCFVVGVIYMDRFIKQQRAMQRDFRINSLNVHRLMLSSIMVAAKFLDDFYYSNEFWAKIGGVSNAELNTLELEFLFMTNFDLHVKRETYHQYKDDLLAWSQGGTSIVNGTNVSTSKSLVSEARMLTVGGDSAMESSEVQADDGDAMVVD